jgi:predicted hydrolase (HD superfamily)
MTRPEAYIILTKYLTDKSLIKHSIAVEAAMRALYRKLTPKEKYNKEEEEKWGITGLLHDADYELARGLPKKHGLLLMEKEPEKIPPDIAYAIKAHNYLYTKVDPRSIMDWAITTCDQLTGMIVAAALMQPDKRIYLLTPEFVMNKFQDKSFAKEADRKTILLCQTTLGLPLEQFIKVVLEGVKIVGKELEL